MRRATWVYAAAMIAVLLAAVPTAWAQDAAGTGTATPGAAAAAAGETYEYGYWLPPLASKHGGQIDGLINIMHWFMGALFVGWGAFFCYCLVRFRARPGHRAEVAPVKASVSKYGEIAVAIFEAVILIGFSIPIWASAKTEIPSTQGAFVVRVVAQQFAWNVHYPGPDGEFGRTSPEFNDEASNPIGLDPNDARGKDDFYTINDLTVPLGQNVFVRLTSKDVIHSFFLPVMRVKQDVIPGMEIPVWFEPTEAGRSEVQCAQLCGNNHSIMRGYLTVADGPQFTEWMDKQTAPQGFFDEDFDE